MSLYILLLQVLNMHLQLYYCQILWTNMLTLFFISLVTSSQNIIIYSVWCKMISVHPLISFTWSNSIQRINHSTVTYMWMYHSFVSDCLFTLLLNFRASYWSCSANSWFRRPRLTPSTLRRSCRATPGPTNGWPLWASRRMPYRSVVTVTVQGLQDTCLFWPGGGKAIALRRSIVEKTIFCILVVQVLVIYPWYLHLNKF